MFADFLRRQGFLCNFIVVLRINLIFSGSVPFINIIKMSWSCDFRDLLRKTFFRFCPFWLYNLPYYFIVVSPFLFPSVNLIKKNNSSQK